MSGPRLRPGQLEVAAYTGGYLAVPAVPGAGKTTTLAHLAAHLIAEGVPGRGRILVVTYQNSGVGNFRARIGDRLEERGLPRGLGYEVRTIHSLAAQILRRRPERRLLPERPVILDDVTREELLREEVRRWTRRHPDALRDFLDEGFRDNDRARARWEQYDFPGFVRQVIGHCKARRLVAAELLPRVEDLPEGSFLRPALEIYAAYQERLRWEGALDFDDLLVHAYELLSQEEGLLERLRRRWPYVFEDEAQDSNPLQEQLLLLLAGPGGNLVRVGDANQAILSTFTNADPRLFREFCRLPEVAVRSLRESSRSSRDIIDLANFLVRWVREEHPCEPCRDALENQDILPVAEDDPYPNPTPNGYRIVARRFGSLRDELEHLAGRLPRALAAADKTVAVLMPTNRLAEEFAAILERRDVPCRPLTSAYPGQQKLARDVSSLVAFLAAPAETGALREAVECLLPEASESVPWLEFLGSTSPEEIFFPLDGRFLGLVPDNLSADPLWPQLYGLLRRMVDWLELAWELPPDAMLLRLAEELDVAEADTAVLQAVALEARRRLAREPQLDLVQLAPQVRELVRGAGHVARAVYDRQGFRADPGVVYVTTFHKAKGLEWDTVYLVHLNESNFPSSPEVRVRGDLYYLGERFRPDRLAQRDLARLLGEEPPEEDDLLAVKEDEIRERLRLLYVGVTRARENLFLGVEDAPGKGAVPRAFRAMEAFVAGRREEARPRAGA